MFFGQKKLIKELKWEVSTLQFNLKESKAAYEAQIQLLRQQVAKLAAGKPVDPGAVLEGRPFSEINSMDLQMLIEKGDKPFVLDVRTNSEWSQGYIEGAMHIDVNELDSRMSMLQNKSTPIYVICASGGRSAAASELLAKAGYDSVTNVMGGMSAFQGKVVRPALKPLSTEGLPGDPELLQKIASFMDQNVRPSLQNDGGDLEFHGIQNDIALLRLSGACGGCGSRDTTVNVGIKEVLTKEFPQIKGVSEI